MNNQKPEPRAEGDGLTLDLHSMFFTLQGEGPFAGHRSIFVRLAGCNLQCPGCDTEYTEGRETIDTPTLLRRILEMAELNNAPCCLVVITGGEPLRQSIGYLLDRLVTMRHHVQIESNGVLAPCGTTEYLAMTGAITLVISPKTSRINRAAHDAATCFKYVLDHRSVNPIDGLPFEALEHRASTGVARPRPGAPVYLNPYDAKNEIENQLNLATAAVSCLKFGHILGVQMHKLAGLE